MAEPDHILDTDFDSQMRGLFEQAEQALTKRPAASPKAEEEPLVVPISPSHKAPEEKAAPEPAHRPTEPGKSGSLSFPQMLRPVVLGLEAMTRAAGENSHLLTKIEKAASHAAEAHQDLPRIVSDLKALLETRNGVSQGMFKALHEELKGYKDGFLLEAVQRPIIRDLITLYDDLSEIRRQVELAVQDQVQVADGAPAAAILSERLQITQTNIEHNLEFIVEILARLEVTQLAVGLGKLDKRTQRAVAIEPTDSKERDGTISRSVRRGFLWKDRVIRAEEVVILKFQDSISEKGERVSYQSSSQKKVQ